MTKVCFETESKAEFTADPKEITEEKHKREAQNRTVRKRVQTINLEDSKTQQQFAAAHDVNNIISKYKKTGELPLARKQGVFADVSTITDYHDSLNRVINANAAFMRLPADLRTRFGNDPAQLLAFLQDPNNNDEGVKLGIYDAPKPDPQIQNQNDEQTKPKTKKQQTQTPNPDQE